MKTNPVVITFLFTLGLFVALLTPAQVRAQETDTMDKDTAAKLFPKQAYSPAAGHDYPTHVYWGDTHVHTSYSMDAGAFGARLGPKDAYIFAKGNEITTSTGQRAKLSRPLDFIVVTDHSDGFGFFPKLFGGDSKMLAYPQGRRWYDLMHSGQGATAAIEIITSFSQGKMAEGLLPLPGSSEYRAAWDETIKAAEEANEPGRFTAFIGFEWTSNTGGNNLHRNILFRDNGDKASMVEPYTTQKPLGSDNPRDLWKWMADYEQKSGGQVLAIAHNGNLSNGRMFPLIESFTGKPIDREYAQTRAFRERIYEVTQIKGDGETHPFLSPNDEFAGYERWDKGNLDLSVLKTNDMLEFEYARSALRNGLKIEKELGVNPYKFGMVGSTDSHTGLATADEDNFWGKTSSSEPSPDRATHPFVKTDKAVIMGWEQAASGYAGVWATDNTREALFDAMQRKEVYATTGPRMIVRFFGGWDFDPKDAQSRNPANPGYTKGVPMGGDLSNAPSGKAPSFLVAAMKDPMGANLDRVQVIKGWLDASGQTHEKIYDVAVSDNRKIAADGRCKTPVGDTVDVPNATYTNTIGASELITVWKDPEFDAAQPSFYYVRVLEIPTPRWTAYDAKYFGVTMPAEVPMKGQERAYTSPIWYTPAK
jgi:hypothetical protein